MVKDVAFWKRWEDEQIRRQPADLERNLLLIEGLWEEARWLGVLPHGADSVSLKAKRERVFMFRDLLVKMATEFERRSIAYMLIGGQAVLLYGEPRLTADVDVTVGVAPEQFSRILEAVQALGWQVRVNEPEEFVRRTLVLPCQDEATGIHIDVIFAQSAYEQQALQRVRRVRMGEAEVCFASVEDVVIHKVVAGRPRDIEDARRIWLKNPNIDEDYLRYWLQQFEEALGEPYLARLEEVKS
ncbi:MAG: nucleotidyltransferase [Armatimonadetes bacterium]|nr:nucleotidyltransferase [Armatimonadota bacterium]